MRIESSVTAISWIPSEAIQGMPKLPFGLGIGHYDEPPPDQLEEGDLERLRDADRFREANVLKAWIEVEDGRIVGHGHEGAGLVGSTTFRLRDKELTSRAWRSRRSTRARGAGRRRPLRADRGRPRRLPSASEGSGKPFFRIHSATAWTTLALTIRADGSSDDELVGASRSPRHWIYDSDGQLVQKAGTIDFKTWYREALGRPGATRTRMHS